MFEPDFKSRSYSEPHFFDPLCTKLLPNEQRRKKILRTTLLVGFLIDVFFFSCVNTVGSLVIFGKFVSYNC